MYVWLVQLTSMTKVRSLGIWRTAQNSPNSWREVDDPRVLVADDRTALVFQNAVDLEPHVLPARVSTDEIRAVEDGVDFDGA